MEISVRRIMWSFLASKTMDITQFIKSQQTFLFFLFYIFLFCQIHHISHSGFVFFLFWMGLYDLCAFSYLFSIEDTSSSHCSSLTILELSATLKNLIPCFPVSTSYQFGFFYPFWNVWWHPRQQKDNNKAGLSQWLRNQAKETRKRFCLYLNTEHVFASQLKILPHKSSLNNKNAHKF